MVVIDDGDDDDDGDDNTECCSVLTLCPALSQVFCLN